MMNRKRGGTILVSALLILAAFTIAVNDVSAATSPSLGAAGSYSVLAGSTVTNTGTTIVSGDLGVSPGSAITGFPPGIVGGTIHSGDAHAALAQAASTAAYNNLLQTCDHRYGPGDQDLTLLSPLGPGVYCADSSFSLSGTLRLSGSGVWIFRAGSTLITASNSKVEGGDPCNVWWQVGSSATLGSGTTFIGDILALASITLNTGASLNGRALAQTGAVTLDSNTINTAICSVATTTIFTTIFTSTLPGGETTIITTLTTIVMYGLGMPVGGEILPGDTSQLLGFVAILIAAVAIGLGVMFKRRIR
jgi:hypothetical protein